MSLFQTSQKYISDYISRHRNARGVFRQSVRRVLQRHFYQPPEKRFGRIFAFKRAKRHREYYLCLRDAAIEFARHGQAGEAVKIASVLPPEYMNAHLKGCLEIVRNDAGKQFDFASIEISTACNIRCPRCYHGGLVEDAGFYPNLNRLMSLPDLRAIWDKIKGRVSSVQLQGMGEAFLHPDIYEIIDYISPAPIWIDTNGNVPIDAERIVGKNLAELVFSIDGIDQRTYEKYRVGGDFEKVVANLKKVVETKKRLKAKTPIITFKFISFKHNEMYIEGARQLAGRLGADKFFNNFCQFMSPQPRLAEMIERFVARGPQAPPTPVEYYDLSNSRTVMREGRESPYCPRPARNFMVLVDGRVIPCCHFYKLPWGDLNLLQRGFEEIWHDRRYVEFRRLVLTDRNQDPICRSCQLDLPGPARKVFENTELAYPAPPPLGDRLIRPEELAIDESSAKDFLPEELEYFRKAGKYGCSTGESKNT